MAELRLAHSAGLGEEEEEEEEYAKSENEERSTFGRHELWIGISAAVRRTNRDKQKKDRWPRQHKFAITPTAAKFYSCKLVHTQ